MPRERKHFTPHRRTAHGSLEPRGPSRAARPGRESGPLQHHRQCSRRSEFDVPAIPSAKLGIRLRYPPHTGSAFEQRGQPLRPSL